jgi:tRNA dimethylallyltransferase
VTNTPPIIPVILGTTASGKTSVGIELAKLCDGEIISVDSRKVYQGLPIGTAVPEGNWEDNILWVENIAHHLIGFLPPDKPYTAGDFSQDAERLIQEIIQRGKTPILVGGTGFYFKALDRGLPPLPKADEKFRSSLETRIEKHGVASVYSELQTLDPIAAKNITHADRHKIIRALEIFHLTGRPFSSWKEQPKKSTSFPFCVMGLQWAKEILDQRIEDRSTHMYEEGMIEEAEAVLKKKGYSPDCHALASFGYREAVKVIQGLLPREEFLPRLIHGTKAFAKRQRTWFRTQVRPAWFPCDNSSKKEEIAMKMKAFCYTHAT